MIQCRADQETSFQIHFAYCTKHTQQTHPVLGGVHIYILYHIYIPLTDQDQEQTLIVTLRVFDNQIYTVYYALPSSRQSLLSQQLKDGFTELSLVCDSCQHNESTTLLIPKGPINIYVVLSDQVLSVFHIDEKSCNLTQVRIYNIGHA